MIRSLLATFLCSLLLPGPQLLAQRVPGQAYTPEPGIRWSTSNAVEAGSMRGVVVRFDTSEPVEGAQIFLQGTSTGALSGEDGRFHIGALPDGEWTLVAEMIGHQRASASVTVDGESGVAAHIGLREAPSYDCDYVCPGECLNGVVLLIRDALTATAPDVPVTISIEADGLADTVRAPPGRRPDVLRVGVGAELETAGPFEVQVSSSAHVDWRASNVWIQERACGRRFSDALQVWLLPS